MTRLLEVRGICKTFPGVRALSGIDFSLDAGRVHALVGKNGAGKSTLIKILSGVERPDEGTILLGSLETRFDNPSSAMAAGIAVVHQELSLVPQLSVAENLFLGRWPCRFARVDWSALRRRAKTLLAPLDETIDPTAAVGTLGVAQQQLVEIGKALSQGARILILDEPTSALSEADAGRLLRVVRELACGGVGIVYISHRLKEVQAVADDVTVLRDGRIVGRDEMRMFDRARLVALMVGKEPEQAPAIVRADHRKVMLSVCGLCQGDLLKDVSFQLHEGEILGIAGLVGAGRTELVRTIFGADPMDEGTIHVDGRAIRRPTIRKMLGLRVALLPEDRRRQSLLLTRSVRENLVLSVLWRLCRGILLSRRKESMLVDQLIRDLQVVAASSEVTVETLSGGNQQKVVLGKWLASRPRILLLDEPTRGVDVDAKAQILRILRELAGKGLSIVFISSELEEVLMLSHRVLVMARGRIVADRPVEEVDLSGIMLSAVA